MIDLFILNKNILETENIMKDDGLVFERLVVVSLIILALLAAASRLLD